MPWFSRVKPPGPRHLTAKEQAALLLSRERVERDWDEGEAKRLGLALIDQMLTTSRGAAYYREAVRAGRLTFLLGLVAAGTLA